MIALFYMHVITYDMRSLVFASSPVFWSGDSVGLLVQMMHTL